MTSSRRRSVAQWCIVFLKGAAMGIAEAIPGVSGGTIAFITGVYHELLSGIASFGPSSPRVLVREGWTAFAERHRLAFLSVLGAGMAVSLVTMAGLIARLLDTMPVLVWSFFFGLIAASVVDLVRGNVLRHLLTAGVVGVFAGLFLALADIAPGEVTTVRLFGGAALAVCAWILPGISGSYVLLLLGLYPAVIAAVGALDLAVLGPVAAGCLVGLSLFSRVLSWLMTRFYFPIVALLTGFMAGALPTLWPWHLRSALPGFERDVDMPVAPWTHAAVTGQDPQVLPALLIALAGCATIGLLALARGGRPLQAADRRA